MEVAEVHARLEHVTVYSSGARVRRVTTIPAPLPSRVRIGGLPLSVIDDTVRVEIGGPALAVAARVGVDAPSPGSAGMEESDEVRGAKRRAALADSEVERLRGALDVVAAAQVIEEDPSDEPPAAWAAVVAARRSIIASRAERELALRDQLASAIRAADDARRALEAAIDRDRRTGSARSPKLHELRKYVELELAVAASDEIQIHVEYLVGAARWAPSYVARIEGDQVKLEVRAAVAQDSGEDWTSVPLRLSTAEPERFATLPELAPQKIGRRQQEPAKSGFRAPPQGADALYADYLRDRARRTKPEPKPFSSASKFEDSTYEGAKPHDAGAGQIDDAMMAENWDEGSSHAKERFSTPPQGVAANAAFGASYQQEAKKSARGGGAAAKSMPATMLAAPAPAAPGAPPPRARTSRMESSMELGGSGADPSVAQAPTVPRLDYGNLRMAPPSSPQRGTLIVAPQDPHASTISNEVGAARYRLSLLPLPPGCLTEWTHTYDYAFETDGAVDVRADGAWHSIAVTAKQSTAKLRHVTVPREQPDVFRVASIANTLTAPLLPGPIDVYDRGRFLVTSEVDYTPPGGTVEIGLGVDPAVKIARNTEYREEATGMLRGGLRLIHAIAIDVENLTARAIDLEVRERVPVVRDGDTDIEVIQGKIEPAWERWTPDANAPRDERLRGGFRWKLAVPPGQKRTLRAAYEVKIAGKHELVGGNRRES
ncbi:MAG: DUF4139 domain-containing protein [Kofleriaceae bacterium]